MVAEIAIRFNLLIAYETYIKGQKQPIEPRMPVLRPCEIETVEELYINGLHLEQYKQHNYNSVDYYLADERMLSISTIDTIHNVLHQVFDLAVEDNCIRSNSTDKMLKELKQAHDFEIKERKALTADEQRLFLDFLKRKPRYNHWYPLFAVMFGSGMRIGEVSGLRWCDIDLEEGIIDINHTLVYYSTGKGKKCKFAINTPKTKKGYRKIPMMDFVKEAFLLEKANQEETGITCQVTIDCYTDFIFVNRFGSVQHYGTVNKAIRRIVRD